MRGEAERQTTFVPRPAPKWTANAVAPAVRMRRIHAANRGTLLAEDRPLIELLPEVAAIRRQALADTAMLAEIVVQADGRG